MSPVLKITGLVSFWIYWGEKKNLWRQVPLNFKTYLKRAEQQICTSKGGAQPNTSITLHVISISKAALNPQAPFLPLCSF